MDIKGRHLCVGCMSQLHNDIQCDECGLVQEEYVPIPRCLIPGTVLGERYVIGKVLGEGSFGITYIGWDTVLAIPIAIKEYYPIDFVSRDVLRGKNNTVYTYSGIDVDEYRQQLDNFLDEARNLIHFNHLKSIVSVRDYFFDNNTAYIVMEYVKGVSLKEWVKKNGPMEVQKVLDGFRPLLEDLAQVHKSEIIHRDISPDNVLITPEGKMVLIDFGAAKIQNADLTRSITVVFKRGYSPEEQYRSKGKQGTWTDVYSLCATMYYAISGIAPEESIQRTLTDRIVPIHKLPGVSINPECGRVIMKGMEVFADKRYSSVNALMNALYPQGWGDVAVTNKKRFGYASISIILIVVLVGIIGARLAGMKAQDKGILVDYYIQACRQIQDECSSTFKDRTQNITNNIEKMMTEREQATTEITTEVTTEVTTETTTETTTEVSTEIPERVTNNSDVQNYNNDSSADDELDGFID